MDIEESQIGRRIREIRIWRRMTLTAVAGLAGLSAPYLSMIERGHRPVTKRVHLEAIATALRVSPADLDGRRPQPVPITSSAGHSALDGLEAVLTEWWPGEVPDDVPGRPWPDVRDELRLLTDTLRPASDYAAQGAILPGLLRHLLIHAGTAGTRRAALIGLISAYHAAGNVASRLGAKHLGYVAAERVRAAAEALDDREWFGVAAWTRAQFVSSLSRSRQYSLAVTAAQLPGTRLETRGMGHLTAALAAAAQGDAETSETHLTEAQRMADRIGLANSPWGGATLNFGQTNVGIWRVGIGVELGHGGRVAEIAREVDWQAIPTSRQGAFWMDLGRGLLQEKRTREQGLNALLRAEKLTPQQVRSNVFVREAVSNLLAASWRAAGGRELRGLAHRMGVAPTG